MFKTGRRRPMMKESAFTGGIYIDESAQAPARHWRNTVNPYAKQQKEYLKVKVQTASKEQLVLMLMDGVLRFSEQGRTAIQNKEIEKKQFSLVRSQDIIIELLSGLNHELGGDIAKNLARLYTYSIKRLVEANIKNDTTCIDDVQNIFRNLREAWAVAMDKVHREEAGVESAPQAARPAQEPEAVGAGAGGLKPGATGLSSLSGLSGLKLNAGAGAAPAATGAGLGGLRKLGSLGSFAGKKPEDGQPRLSIQG